MEFVVNSVHIRRTDKVGTEAAFHKLSEYMDHVEEYYKTLELVEPVERKRVYIATDEPKIFEEARTRFVLENRSVLFNEVVRLLRMFTYAKLPRLRNYWGRVDSEISCRE